MRFLYLVFVAFILSNMLSAQTELGQSPIYSLTDTVGSMTDTAGKVLNASPYLSTHKVMAPGNDACTSATSLTIGAALLCGQTTQSGGVQAGECAYPAGGGMSAQTVWYRFTATNDSLILNYLRTNTATFVSYVTVYGPFASGAGCLPACTSTVYTAVQNGDPGSHILLTGLSTTGNSDYLIQIQGFSGGGAGDPFVNFCINMSNPASNINSSVASVISACGTTFNGTTNGGYYASGSGTGFSNLDGNAGTTCGSCAAGADVTFVINNVSWFKFCTANAGTYNVQFDVISCAFTGVNSGAQMAILTGSANALTSFTQAPNPTYTNTAVWTSPNFSLAAGGCAYLVVDGFAGDACSYSYVLTNVSGGCVLLPVELLFFNGKKIDQSANELSWATATEHNSDYFVIEKSANGVDFEYMTQVNGGGNSNTRLNYTTTDHSPFEGETYYRLKQVDYDGNKRYSQIISIESDLDKLSTIVADYNNEDRVDLIYYSSKNTIASVEIYSSNGSLVKKKEVVVINGRNTEAVSKSGLSSGVYVLKLTMNGKIQVQKFIIN
jgi:hypothetical protein